MLVRHKSSAWISTALSGLALLLFLAAPLSAKERRLLKFYSDIDVLSSSSVDVTENITFQFIGGPWQGIYRSIPVEYAGPRGLNYSLFVDVKHVTDENGNKLRFESSRERQYLKLKIFLPNADNSTRTISIEYVVSDALRFFDEHDEFYWNITGDEWPIPIGEAGAHITLPDGTSNIRVNVFTGAYRTSDHHATSEITGTGVDVRTTGSLLMHEGLTVAVAFDKGAVREPSRFSRLFRTVRSNWAFGLPVGAFLFMFWWWWTRGRDPRLRPIAAQYEPPDKLSPGEVGTLVDNSVDMRDITASIVDLAVRGYLVIEQQNKEHLLGLTHSKEYIFHLKKSRAEWSSLQPHEQELLDGIFAAGNTGDTVTLEDLHNRFYKSITPIKNDIFGALVGKGYYARRPDSVRAGYIGFGVLAGILLIWGGQSVAKMMGMAPLPFIVAGIATAAVICAFGWFMPAR